MFYFDAHVLYFSKILQWTKRHALTIHMYLMIHKVLTNEQHKTNTSINGIMRKFYKLTKKFCNYECLHIAWSFVYHKMWTICKCHSLCDTKLLSLLSYCLATYVHPAILINPWGAKGYCSFWSKICLALAASYVKLRCHYVSLGKLYNETCRLFLHHCI